MIVLHHLNKSRSQRIIWLLEELGLPYQIKAYQRDAILLRAFNTRRHRLPAENLAKTVAAMKREQGASIANQPQLRRRL